MIENLVKNHWKVYPQLRWKNSKNVLTQQKNEKIKNRYFCGVSVVMFNVKDLELKKIDHLGIVAGIVWKGTGQWENVVWI